MKLKDIINALLDFAYPDTCLICNTPLIKGEKYICNNCLYQIPRPNIKSYSENIVAEKFYGKIKFEKAISGFIYQKDTIIQKLLEEFKYKNQKDLAYHIARNIALRPQFKDFFLNLDEIIPIPLHPKRYKQRGYNQSEYIAKGISSVYKIPINTTSIYRKINTKTQTKKNKEERANNVKNIFAIKDTSYFNKKSILLVDDVITTGATLSECAKTITNSFPNCKVSFFSISVALDT